MYNLILFSLTLSIGLLTSPIYAVLLGSFLLLQSSLIKIHLHRVDFFVILYVIILFIFYVQIDNTTAVKEAFIFIIGPFLFYFIGKLISRNSINFIKLYEIIGFILIIFSFYLFFKDINGNFYLTLDQNYYYNSRNNFIIKSDLDTSFMNETNLSYLVLTGFFLTFFCTKKKYIKINNIDSTTINVIDFSFKSCCDYSNYSFIQSLFIL